VIVLVVLWYFIKQHLVWVFLLTYSANIVSLFVKSYLFVPFKPASYSFIFNVSQTAPFGECPSLGLVDISYRVFLVPPSKWDDEVILSCRGYFTRYACAVAIISYFLSERMCEVFSSL